MRVRVRVRVSKGTMTRSAQPHAKKPVCGCCRMPPSPRTCVLMGRVRVGMWFGLTLV